MDRFLTIWLLLLPQLPFAQNGTDSVREKASAKYASPSVLKTLLFGQNYRREWETKVDMPVFDLGVSGLKIVRMGGGEQTTSLELTDKHGREWALRSVDKDLDPPKEFMENTFIERGMQDLISGAYPYAGLSVPVIARAAGTSAGEQQLFFVSDDPAFGVHRDRMANQVFILANNQPAPGVPVETEQLIKELDQCDDCFVDQEEYLKARLVDWLVADWDRHPGQWRWMAKDSPGGTSFRIVARDRDQAFYRAGGILAKLTGLLLMPHADRFNSSGRGIKVLSRKTHEFDRRFTSRLNREDWERIIGEFQANVTDSVIEDAIKRQPEEIFEIRGEYLIEKLKSRRDGLPKHVMKYFRFLHGKK